MIKKIQEKGFTIIELMVATTVFSVILLMASSAAIQIGRLYYKQITSTKTQAAAREVLENVSRDLQLSNNKTLDTGSASGMQAYCIGDNQYSYIPGNQVVGNAHGVWLDNRPATGCDPTNFSNSSRELLGENMRLLDLQIIQDVPSRTYAIRVGVAYGDSDLLTAYNNLGALVGSLPEASCRSGVAGSNFCATSSLDTIVKRRIN